MQISETMVFWDSIDDAVALYEQMGLRMTTRQDWGWAVFEDPRSGQKIGVLERGSWRPDDEAMLNGTPIPRVAFESEDLEADLARLEMAGCIVGSVPPPGQNRCSWFKDCSGNSYFIWQEGG